MLTGTLRERAASPLHHAGEDRDSERAGWPVSLQQARVRSQVPALFIQLKRWQSPSSGEHLLAEWGIKHQAPADPATALEGAILAIREQAEQAALTFFRGPRATLRAPVVDLECIPQKLCVGVLLPHCTEGALQLSGNTSANHAVSKGRSPLSEAPRFSWQVGAQIGWPSRA